METAVVMETAEVRSPRGGDGWTRRARLAMGVGLLVALGLAPGCGSKKKPTHAAGVQGLTRTAKQGPVAIRFTVAPTDLATSGHATVTIEVTTEPGAVVQNVDYARQLLKGDGAFEYRVVDRRKLPPKPGEDGTTRSIHRYEIEFILPGDFELPGVEVSYVDTQSATTEAVSEGDAAPKTDTVSTEPITVTVRAPAAVALTPDDLRKIKRLDPVELPGAWDPWWWIAPIITLTVLVLIVVLLRRARRRRAETVVVVPAHEWARRAIAALVSDDLIGRGRVQEFYYRISGIIRGYIERRFDVFAAEMTTEEFLATTADDSRFAAEMRRELNRFLGACDMVKYARYEPGRAESDSVLRAAGEFVERTGERAEKPGITAAAATTTPTEERAA